MSRVGKTPVKIPEGTTVAVKKNTVTVEGPKGKMEQKLIPEIKVKVEDHEVVVTRKNETKRTRAFHGLYRNLINNMVTGVSQGFTKTLLLNGVGYRAEVQGDTLVLNLGYSNPIEFLIPEDLTITCEGNNKIIINGIDKQKVGQAAAEIRFLRPPEPYKGKGIRYEDEHVRRKIGKAGIK
jgi:large subunit ribosomal protein L6